MVVHTAKERRGLDSSTGWHLISASPLTYLQTGLLRVKIFLKSCREIRAGEGGRRDVMEANLSCFQTVLNENEILQFI